ncbi:hypothetical protein Asi03nite_67900 [Actinoplanes siamensis]|uniref:BMP family ABC transporter substrate-binding protein n=1 Tax=Actinoplanes siamensis TaxID=1223317 RepID=A0A919NDI8_9ACTN|nr:hypothetical protein Asi03nite_67900 [Actinoplanes siamensis]
MWGAAGAGRGARRRLPGRPSWWLGGGAAVLALAGLTTWLVWPEHERPDPRARVYTEASACLLTPARGTADASAAPVWAGMQQASTESRGKVSFLEVDGPQTAQNASSFLATLVSGGCDVVLAAGPAPSAAVLQQAGRFPGAKFIAVTTVDDGKSLANVVRVTETAPADVTSRVHALVAGALSGTGD